jgi:DNA-binding ferritin-like protein
MAKTSKVMESLREKCNKVEEKIHSVQITICLTMNDYRRVNEHRRRHLQGEQDEHTKYQTLESHIKGLEDILKRLMNEKREASKIADELIDEADTLYMEMDAEQDLIDDAEISFQEVMLEFNRG